MIEKDGRIYYEVGDRVKVVDKAPDWCNVGFGGRMREFLSRVVTIKNVDDQSYRSHIIYHVEENSWAWENMLFQGLESELFLSDDESEFECPHMVDFLKSFKKTW